MWRAQVSYNSTTLLYNIANIVLLALVERSSSYNQWSKIFHSNKRSHYSICTIGKFLFFSAKISANPFLLTQINLNFHTGRRNPFFDVRLIDSTRCGHIWPSHEQTWLARTLWGRNPDLSPICMPLSQHQSWEPHCWSLIRAFPQAVCLATLFPSPILSFGAKCEAKRLAMDTWPLPVAWVWDPQQEPQI